MGNNRRVEHQLACQIHQDSATCTCGASGRASSPEALFRRTVIAAWERIPVADRGWNQRVADALWNDEKFRAGMYEWACALEDEGIPNHA
jgi:hypothetical protein